MMLALSLGRHRVQRSPRQLLLAASPGRLVPPPAQAGYVTRVNWLAGRRAFTSSPPPPLPRNSKTRHPRQTILAVACAASVLIGIFSEVLWYKFSPHAAAAATARSSRDPLSSKPDSTVGSGRSVHAEPATTPDPPLGLLSTDARKRQTGDDNNEEGSGGDPLLAARLAHLTHLSSLSLYDAYLSDHHVGGVAALSIVDAVRALLRALPDDGHAPSLAEATVPSQLYHDDAGALSTLLAPVTSLLSAAAVANGTSPNTLSPADLRLVGALVATPIDAYTTAFRVLDADASGSLSIPELKRAVSSACGSLSTWIHSPAPDDGIEGDQEWVQPLVCHLAASASDKRCPDQISLRDFTHFLTTLRMSLSSAIYATHASGANGTLMTAQDFAWVLLAMSTHRGDDALGARARLVQVAKDPKLANAVVSSQEWAAFDELIHRPAEFLEAIRVVGNVTEMQVKGDRTIDPDMFRRAARAMGVYLSPVQIDVMCRVLDTNNDGRLCVVEFLRLSDSLAFFGLRGSEHNVNTPVAATTLDPSAPLAQILRSSTGSSMLDIVRELPERSARWWSCVQTAPGPWTVGAKEGAGGCKHHGAQ